MSRLFYIARRDLNAPIRLARHASAQPNATNQFIDPSKEYELQILDALGRATETKYFSKVEIEKLSIISEVPAAVIDTLIHLQTGKAIEIDELGNEVAGF